MTLKKTGNKFMDLMEEELLEAGVPIKIGLDGKPMNPSSILVNHSISATVYAYNIKIRL